MFCFFNFLSFCRLAAAEPEPEESYKSLAEYQAEKEAARVAANLAVREANEGADQSQWKKLTPLVKDAST